MSRLLKSITAAALVVPLAACGGGDPSGMYKAVNKQSIYESLDFQDKGKVTIQAMGQTSFGDYVVTEEGRIRVIAPGGVLTLKEEDGCLVPTPGDAREAASMQQWGASEAELAQMIGRFCPGSGGGSVASSGGSSSGKSPKGSYRSSFGDNGIALNFKGDGNVEVTLIEGRHEETQTTRYTLAGEQIVVQVPNGPSLTLNRRGDDLETTMEGITMRFERD